MSNDRGSDAGATGSSVDVFVAEPSSKGPNSPDNGSAGDAGGHPTGGRRSDRIATLNYRFRESERQRRVDNQRSNDLAAQVTALTARLAGTDKSTAAMSELRRHEEHLTTLDRRVNEAAEMLLKAEDEGDASRTVEARNSHVEAVAERRAVKADLAHRRNEMAAAAVAPNTDAPPPKSKTTDEVMFAAWTADNPWFQKDPAMRKTAMAVHEKIRVAGKIAVGSMAYYRAIDTAVAESHGDSPYMRDDYDPRDDSASGSEPAPGPQYGDGGDAPRGGAGRRVRLDADQVNAAKRMKVPLAQYAAMVAKGDV